MSEVQIPMNVDLNEEIAENHQLEFVNPSIQADEEELFEAGFIPTSPEIMKI